jgi:hypothetical protein
MSDLKEYAKKPVDIITFIEGRNYIGTYTKFGQSIYPFWKDYLKNIFDKERRVSCLLPMCVGCGKSVISGICAAYILYKLMCMENPQRFFGLDDDDEISILFNGCKKDYEVSYKVFENIVKTCSIFSNYIVEIKDKDIFFKNNIIARLSNNKYFVHDNHSTKNIFSYFNVNTHIWPGDQMLPSRLEADINEVEDVHKTYFENFSLTIIESDIVENAKNIIHYFKEISDFGNLKNRVIFENPPQWEIKPRNFYSDESFTVAYNKRRAKIINSLDDLSDFGDSDVSLVQVPKCLHQSFTVSLRTAFRLFLGIDLHIKQKKENLSLKEVLDFLIHPNAEIYRKDSKEHFFVDPDNLIRSRETFRCVDSFQIKDIIADDWIAEYEE